MFLILRRLNAGMAITFCLWERGGTSEYVFNPYVNGVFEKKKNCVCVL